MLGQRLTPILAEIENTLWEFEGKPNYQAKALPAACKIFISVLMDRMWELQAAENMPDAQRCEMAESLGNEIRKLVKTYTGIDTHEMYKANS